jgi:hypothetical protein
MIYFQIYWTCILHLINDAIFLFLHRALNLASSRKFSHRPRVVRIESSAPQHYYVTSIQLPLLLASLKM